MPDAAPARRGFRRVLSIPAPPPAQPRPAEGREASLARFDDLRALDDERVGETTRSQLFEPAGDA
ncbi:MAG: hypothetical protein AAGC63_03305, partial [Propionicimonas sp.]|nr:hypothetical protein [Propionicimonas sp.]